MTLTTVVQLLFTVTVSVASESMTVRGQVACSKEYNPLPCDPVWIVEVIIVRTMEAVLALVAVMITAIIVLNWRRASGVFSYPCSIASMAALLSHTEVIEDLRRIDPNANSDAVAEALGGSRYTLENFESSPGVMRYGLSKTVATMPPRRSQSSLGNDYAELPNPANNDSGSKAKRKIPWKALLDPVFIAIQVGLFALILAYYVDLRPDPFTRFFDAATFGPRFVLVVIATIIDDRWKELEREVRIMVPYRKLAKQNAKSREIILMSLHGVPLTTFPFAVWYRNFFHAFVAFTAISSDLLIILVSGVPYSYGQIPAVSAAASLISLAVLGFMIVANVAVVVWRRGNPQMPRDPDTLASVWMMMCGSRMVGDFEGMERVERDTRDAAVRRSQRRYWFAKARGLDDKERHMIDLESDDDEETGYEYEH